MRGPDQGLQGPASKKEVLGSFFYHQIPEERICGSGINPRVNKMLFWERAQYIVDSGITPITQFLDLAVAKSLQSTRMVTDDDADADADVLTTTGYSC